MMVRKEKNEEGPNWRQAQKQRRAETHQKGCVMLNVDQSTNDHQGERRTNELGDAKSWMDGTESPYTETATTV